MKKIYDEGRWQAWVDANLSFMQKTVGKESVVACAGHMDEVTFHLHFTVVPIILGQAAEREDTKMQFEKRNGKEKRRYRKQEVTARLCARDVFTQENAERWQTEYALHMQAAGFDLKRGIHGSKAKHTDPAVYNAIKAEEAKLEAEKDGLKMQKEVLEDEVDTLQSEKDALTIEIETLNWEKKQAETAVNAVALMGGRYVSLPCAGGGSVSSETGWDGRKKDEENEDFRLRCWHHAAKTVKASRYVPTKRKGYDR